MRKLSAAERVLSTDFKIRALHPAFPLNWRESFAFGITDIRSSRHQAARYPGRGDSIRE
jgi:hypothetical protein